MIRKLVVVGVVFAAFAFGEGWFDIPRLTKPQSPISPRYLVDFFSPPTPAPLSYLDQLKVSADDWLHAKSSRGVIVFMAGLAAASLVCREQR